MFCPINLKLDKRKKYIYKPPLCTVHSRLYWQKRPAHFMSQVHAWHYEKQTGLFSKASLSKESLSSTVKWNHFKRNIFKFSSTFWNVEINVGELKEFLVQMKISFKKKWKNPKKLANHIVSSDLLSRMNWRKPKAKAMVEDPNLECSIYVFKNT